MKFLIDAQLPPVLKFVFSNRGYEAYHTLDLPKKKQYFRFGNLAIHGGNRLCFDN